LRRGPDASDEPASRSDLTDLCVLQLGFSLLWAGFFFAQFLVIWYGNLPEEVRFIADRVSSSPLRELSVAVLFLFFFIPFPVFLSTRAKSSPYTVCAVSLSVLSGILVERYVFLAPEIPLSSVALAVDFSCLLALFLLVMYREVRGYSP
jgi:hypothetical protein